MRIDLDGLEQISDRLLNVRKVLEESRELITHTRLALQEQEMLQQNDPELSKIEQEMDSQICTLQKYVLVVEKTHNLFLTGEQRIESVIEGDAFEKAALTPLTRLQNNTHFSWRVK